VTSNATDAPGGRRFVVSTLVLAAAVGAVLTAINWRINAYGVFGDPPGESRTVISNERQTKYLFSFNYIPGNFDALLVGSSIASNIDTSKIHGMRMYNAALSGGNITEESLIAENALRRGHLRFLVAFLNPYLVQTNGRKAGGMSPRDFWGALGSTDLMSSYLGGLAIRTGLVHQRFTAEGMQDISDLQRPPADVEGALNAARAPGNAAQEISEFALDATALEQLAELAQLARARGAAVIWVFAPVYSPTYDMRRPAYRKFEDRIRALAKPGELIINFNDGSFAALTTRANSFLDGVHLSNGAALEVARTLDQFLAALVHF
jgi:hypothetical protein